MTASPQRGEQLVWHFQGIDARGFGRNGATTSPPVDFVRRQYEAGWRRLTVWHGDRSVGEISDTYGERTWFVESDDRYILLQRGQVNEIWDTELSLMIGDYVGHYDAARGRCDAMNRAEARRDELNRESGR